MIFVQQLWDADLALQADTYAKLCIFAHPSDLKEVGQNLYITTASPIDLAAATQSWYNEKADYNFATKSCTAGKMCGHYTQVTNSTINW